MTDHRLYQAVADQLKRRIFEGVYQPGGRLPGERELAEELGVSRVTVREAEIALQAIGYITVKAGSGAYVNANLAHPEDGLPLVSALELTQARLMFESEAAALAASAIDDETLASLEILVTTMSQSHPDDATAQAADRDFHLTIAAASHNAAVQHTIEILWRMRTELPAVRDAHAAVCSDAMAKERGNEHRAILRALTERDPAAARKAMQDHFTRLLASMIDASEAKAVEELRSKANASRHRYLNSLPQSGAA